jgi:uncharacterized protein YecT (DUF1311 family)
MKQISYQLLGLFIIFFTILSTFSAAAQSQHTMTQDAARKYAKADKELNTFYQKILVNYKKQARFINKTSLALEH